jgi:transposase-like protein
MPILPIEDERRNGIVHGWQFDWPRLAGFFMDFPISSLMDEQACYDWLVRHLHPPGLACPDCRSQELSVHRRQRAPILDYRCRGCGAVFNAFSRSVFHKTSRKPSELILTVRGIVQGQSTSQLARELSRDRGGLLNLRHRLQASACLGAAASALPDAVVECDEMYQNAGEKRRKARRPGRPAASKGQQEAGPRHVGRRPPAGAGRRGTRERPTPADGAAPQHAGGD